MGLLFIPVWNYIIEELIGFSPLSQTMLIWLGCGVNQHKKRTQIHWQPLAELAQKKERERTRTVNQTLHERIQKWTEKSHPFHSIWYTFRWPFLKLAFSKHVIFILNLSAFLTNVWGVSIGIQTSFRRFIKWNSVDFRWIYWTFKGDLIEIELK